MITWLRLTQALTTKSSNIYLNISGFLFYNPSLLNALKNYQMDYSLGLTQQLRKAMVESFSKMLNTSIENVICGTQFHLAVLRFLKGGDGWLYRVKELKN